MATSSQTRSHVALWKQEAVAGFRAPKLVCFNLGYLPAAARKDVRTESGTTAAALAAAHGAVAAGGCVCVLAYIGHDGARRSAIPGAHLMPLSPLIPTID